MKWLARAGKSLGMFAVLGIGLELALSISEFSQTAAPGQRTTPKEKIVSGHAAGGFDVKITPEALADKNPDPTLGRMSIDKQYHGDLDATGKGEMLTAGSSVKGSGVYVAIEQVAGTLQGRMGSFVLHHTGIMRNGTPELKIMVAPDSGTGELVGLSGMMNIKIADGKHSYEFDYTLPEKQ